MALQDLEFRASHLDFRLMQFQEPAQRSSLGGSPSTKRGRRPKVPSHWGHATSCDCALCRDISLNGLLLQLQAAQAEGLHLQHVAQQASGFTDVFMRHLEPLTVRAQRALQGVMFLNKGRSETVFFVC